VTKNKKVCISLAVSILCGCVAFFLVAAALSSFERAFAGPLPHH
jgi:hypothetical protein